MKIKKSWVIFFLVFFIVGFQNKIMLTEIGGNIIDYLKQDNLVIGEEVIKGAEKKIISLNPKEDTKEVDIIKENYLSDKLEENKEFQINGYIIEFEKEPVLERKTELEKEVRWVKKSSVEISKEIKDYNTEIKKEHEIIKGKIEEKLLTLRKKGVPSAALKNNKLETLGEYEKVFNGIILNVSYIELREIKKVRGVRKVYPNYEVHATLADSVPLINADDVWKLDKDGNDCTISGKDCLTGKGIKIAIIDSGVDYTHLDLGGCFGSSCKVIAGYDFVNKDNNPMDDYGHGTHVAGIAAGKGTLNGVAPDAKLYSYKVLDESGSGWLSDAILAIDRATDPNQDGDFSDHADIISMSLGMSCFGGYNELCGPDDAISQAVDNAVNTGVIVVISAGNSGPNLQTIGTPGTARKAITVGAVDKSEIIASFSSRGPVYSQGHIFYKPDLVTPGVNINSAKLGGGYIEMSGTSMATPHVSGAAALLKQKNPDWIPEEIKEGLKSTSVNLGYGVNDQGYGRIDVLSAIKLANLPNLADLDSYGKVSGIINVKGSASGSSFQSYSLSYSKADSPEIWIELITSTSQVSKGLLYGNFDTTLLTDGIISLKLNMKLSDKSEINDIDYMIIDNIYIHSPQNENIFGKKDGIINIVGSARGTNFKNYEIKISNSEEWFTTGITLTDGKNQVIDGVLGTLDLNEVINILGDGIYTLKLIVYNTDGLVNEDSVTISIENYFDGWPIYFSGNKYIGFSTPVVGDIDNDGDLEVVLAVDNENKIYAWHHDGTLVDGWPKLVGGGIPSLADLDGNGDLEIVVGSSGLINAFHHDGTLVNGWPIEVKYTVTEGEPILSLSNRKCPGACIDGRCELVPQVIGECNDDDGGQNMFLKDTTGRDSCVGNQVKEFYCEGNEDYPYIFSLSYSCPFGCNDRACNPNPEHRTILGCMDTDGGDNRFEKGITECDNCKGLGNGVFEDYCSDSNTINEYHCNYYWIRLGTFDGDPNPPAIGDIDGDGDLEIVVAIMNQLCDHNYNYLFAWHHDGTLVDGWPVSFKDFREDGCLKGIQGIPSLADLDRDGDLEITFGTSYYQYVLNHDGSLFDGNNDGIADWPQRLCLKDLCGEDPYSYRFSKSASIGDINNDGELEIVVIANDNYWDSSDGRYSALIHVFKKDGTELPGFPLELEDQVRIIHPNTQFSFSPALVDINNDGYLEIITFARVTEGPLHRENSYSSGEIIIINYDGTYYWPKGFRGLIDEAGLEHEGSGVIVADIDGDSDLEILISGGWDASEVNKFFSRLFSRARLFAWHHDGTKVIGFPKILPYPGHRVAISIADVDNNGDLEIIGGGGVSYPDYVGAVYILDLLDAYNSDNLEWPMSYHDPQHTSCYGCDKATSPVVCGDGICRVGENCPEDVGSCADKICYEPTCINGCSEVPVANGKNDEACLASDKKVCDGSGKCVNVPTDTDNDGVVDTDDNCPSIYNPLQEDSDNDNAGDVCDKCPETYLKSPIDDKVNTWGCILPKFTKFSHSLTTDFENVENLRDVSSFWLGIEEKGRIIFSGKLLNLEGLDFDSYVNIGDKRISIDSNNLPVLNMPAILHLYNINFITPKILMNGVECSDCNKVSYSEGTLVVEVPHFTEYTIEETCGDDTCAATESCSSCLEDCGACPSSPPSGGGSSGGGGRVSRVPNISQNTIPLESCISNWACTNWSICENRIKTRTCADLNNCTPAPIRPSEIEDCECIEDLVCDRWSLPDFKGVQRRECIDINACGTEKDKPLIEKPLSKKVYYSTIGVIALLVVIIAVFLVRFIKKKKR